MSWTPEQYEAYQRRSAYSEARASRISYPPQSAKPEPAVQYEPLSAAQGEGGNSTGFLVCITSFRKRLLDTDNLVGGSKYFTDSLRYAGLIHGDAENQITLQVKQVKDQDERTEITITQL